MMTDGNRDTAAKADEESNKITTTKIPHVVTTDGAFPDIGTPIDEQAKEISDPVRTTDEQVNAIRNPATPTDEQTKEIQDPVKTADEQAKEIRNPATPTDEQVKEIQNPATKIDEQMKEIQDPVRTTDEQAKEIPDPVTNTDEQTEDIQDPATPTDEQAKEIPDPVTPTDEQTKQIQDPVRTTDEQAKEIRNPAAPTDEQAEEITDPVTTANERSEEIPCTVTTTDIGSQGSQVEEEFVHVPNNLKRFVIGMGGIVVKTIEQISGAEVVTMPGDDEGFTVIGNEEQIACAKKLISEKVEGVTTHKENDFNEVSYYIDELNLPADCKLKLEQVAPEDSIILPEGFTQYRIKPVKAEDFNSADDDPSYMSKLRDDTSESIRRMKSQMETKRHVRVEMCCDLGMVIVCRRMKEDENSDAEWTVEEATNNLRESQWRTTFKARVNLNENVLQEQAFGKTPKGREDYSSRYDLTFLMAKSQQINIWVWVAKKNLGKRLEDIPIPPGHLQNVLEEIHFKDELTRSRCRGWLVLRPQLRYLRTDILFPGCEFDCRITITGNRERALEIDPVPEEDKIRDLARYVSEVTFVEKDSEDDFEILLPEQNLPDGFQLSYIRCSKRALYEFMPGFKIVVSKEISRDMKTTRFRVWSAFYLPCDESEDLLNTGEWQPEVLVKKLPDFFRFVRKVQSLFGGRMEEVGLIQKDKSEFVPVPKDLICYVIGRRGRVIKEIRKISGARVFHSKGIPRRGLQSLVMKSREQGLRASF